MALLRLQGRPETDKVLEELAALAKIAATDAQALKTDTELDELPARIARLDDDVKRLGELLDAEKQELRDADALLQAQEEELNNQSQALARSKAKSARARNMREADAVERELEVIRRTMKDREAERETLREAIEKRRASVEKHETEFAELQRFAAEEKEKSAARLGELNAKREVVLAGRKELADKIPARIMRRYELVRSKRAGIGAVPMKGSICTGCNTTLPPNQMIAVQTGETFEQCPRCNRLLFDADAIEKLERGD